MRRREFLGTPVLFAAQAANPPWFDRPMRWAQLTLVENDPGTFDPDFWLDYFRRIHADATCLSAGGCVAYYPTNVPLHHRSAWLGNSDPFGYLVAGCRKLGMVVLARKDPHSCLEDARAAHPDWIAVDAQGRQRPHCATPGRWVTCALGPYNFEFMNAVTREIVERYKVDGVFSNRWSGSGMCYCEHCRRNFRASTGRDLPSSQRDRDYLLWRQQRLFELWRLWDAEIRKANPDARFIANAGGGALSTLDMKTIGELAPTLFADRQARRGLMPPWAAGKNAKEYRATLGMKPIGGIFSVGIEEPYRWKDSVQSEAEIRIWVADATANGLRPWFTKFSGTLHDRRWLNTVEKIYQWHHANERYRRNQEPVARVGVVYSQQSAWFYGAKVEEHTLGMYHALIEARVPFEMVHDRLLDRIANLKLLILPNIAALSDSQSAQIRAFVERGGSVLATFETSLYDEWGKPRPDFGLGGLFGVRYGGKVEGPMQNSYLRVEHETRHPILAGLTDAGRIINGTRRVEVVPAAPFGPAPLTLVPSYPDLPMEEVYPRVPKTNSAQVYLREVGRGRVVYFPWDIDRTYWEVMAADHGTLLRNAIAWALNEEPPVRVTGPGVLDVTMWRQRDSLTVHLVNLTNPMMMKGPYRELIPAPAQRVEIRMPRAPRRVRLLTAGTDAPFTYENGRIALTVPGVLDHEVIAVE